METEEHAYIVKQEDLIGEIENFPIEVVQKMVDEQVRQGNKANVTVFQKDKESSIYDGGFYWGDAEDGFNFWKNVIHVSLFGVLFDKYPEGKDKYNFDENGCIIKEDKNVSTDSNKNETDKDYNVETIWDGFTLKDMKVPKGTFSTIPKNEQEFHNILIKMYETYKKKNSDYGSSFDKSMDEFGIIAPVIRMSDKMNRLKSLVKNKQQVKDESIDDTLLDLANYAVMTLVYRNTNMDKQMPSEDDLKWFNYLSKHFDDKELRGKMLEFIQEYNKNRKLQKN